MELEIKHLATYLPYGLKLQYVVREKVEKTGIIKSISHNEDETHPTRVSISAMYNEEHIWMFKPILRPLSDLTKEIEYNGEKFVPLFELFKLINDYHLVDFDINYSEKNISFQIDDNWNHIMTFNDIDLQFGYDENDFIFHLTESFMNYSFNYIQMHEKLYEWKFDVFNLIENGLSVAVTDEFNPYK
jgi:hypothetical protein